MRGGNDVNMTGEQHTRRRERIERAEKALLSVVEKWAETATTTAQMEALAMVAQALAEIQRNWH